MKYRFIQQYDSTKAKDGEYLMLELLVKNADDSVLFSTKSYGTLFPFRFDSYKMKIGLDNPLEEGFHMMTLGDSAHFMLAADELYKSSFTVSLPDKLFRQNVSVFAKVAKIYDYEAYNDWREQQVQARHDFRPYRKPD